MKPLRRYDEALRLALGVALWPFGLVAVSLLAVLVFG